MTRLTPSQTQSAKDRVEPCAGGFRYWTVDASAPVFATRREAESASIDEWRANLEPQS